MKDLRGRIIAGILAFIGVFFVVYFVVLYNNEKDKEEYIAKNELKKYIAQTPNPGYKDYDEPEIDDYDDLYEDQKITGNTRYIVETYYLGDNNSKEPVQNVVNIPSEFISMDKDDLEDYLEEYVENMPLEEYLDGLLSFEIISFSEDEIKVRKTYASDMNESDYYISDVEGEIVVFYSDKDTVYDYTGIKTDTLEPEEQVKVKIGYYVKDDEELYGMLESYSS